MAPISPLFAAKAGNRAVLKYSAGADPVLRELIQYKASLIHEVVPQGTQEEPVADDRAYSVDGSSELRCRPFVKVGWREGWLPGPTVAFEQRDDGAHLTASIVEDRARRAAGALPFDVRVTSVRLVYGTDPNDVVDFPNPVQEPATDPAAEPAFSVGVDAVIPADQRARVVAAMQAGGRATWVVAMEFQWTHVTPAVGLPPRPRPKPHPRRPRWIELAKPIKKPLVPLDEIFVLPREPSTTLAVKTITIERRLAADYPPITPENRAIYAPITGEYAIAGWRKSAHGWYQPSTIDGTVYCLPDAYRLQVDEVTGLPSIVAVLHRSPSATGRDDDPSTYKTRLTLKVKPDFDPDRLDALRGVLRGESGGVVKYADLVLGGYSDARFTADDSLRGLGELFGGATAGDRAHVDAAEGFTLTYEGSAELVDLLYQRLLGEGIRGTVELDLVQPDGSKQSTPVPVILTLRNLAPLGLPLTLVEPPAAGAGRTYTVVPGDAPYRIAEKLGARPGHLAWWQELKDANPQKALTAGGANWSVLSAGNVINVPDSWPPSPLTSGGEPPPEPSPDGQLTQSIRVRNSTRMRAAVDRIQATALRRSPSTGRVDEYFPAQPEGVGPPFELAPGQALTLSLKLDAPAFCNAWDIALVNARPVLSDRIVLSSLFDAATSGVRGWKIAVESPPLEFFEQLKPEEQEPIRDVVAIEIEVRRLGSSTVDEVKLTRAQPRGEVLLSRTVADFIGDRSTGRSTFEYRQRLLRVTRADDFSEWKQETGGSLTIYIS